MRFIEVKKDEIKKPKTVSPHNAEAELTEFLNMNVEAARVVLGKSEYRNLDSAINALRNAARRYGMPIKVAMIENNIYLIRKDI